MKVRILGGYLKGRVLKYPSSPDTRPTTGLVKEAIFSIIGELKGKRVLDLFSSAGALGIEALSRGAEYVVFVEKSSKTVKYLSQNLKELGIKTTAWIVHGDAIRFLKKNREEFDVVFADPPYRKGYIEKLLNLVENSLKSHGIFIIEHESEKTVGTTKNLKKIKERKYGDTKITVFEKDSSLSGNL